MPTATRQQPRQPAIRMPLRRDCGCTISVSATDSFGAGVGFVSATFTSLPSMSCILARAQRARQAQLGHIVPVKARHILVVGLRHRLLRLAHRKVVAHAVGVALLRFFQALRWPAPRSTAPLPLASAPTAISSSASRTSASTCACLSLTAPAPYPVAPAPSPPRRAVQIRRTPAHSTFPTHPRCRASAQDSRRYLHNRR